MQRREFITFLGGACLVSSLASADARGQRVAKVRRLGILQPGAPPEPLVDAMRDRLRELGCGEGQDLSIEIRWAEGSLDRLHALAAELVSSKVDVITTLSTPAALAAREATATIPIVFTGVGDPVGTGVVHDLARPGGNVTGSV